MNEEVNDELKDKYLLFELDENYAIELSKVLEIIETGVLTKVPETPAYIPGVMNLRGNVIPIVDLRIRFRKKPNDTIVNKYIVIIDFEGTKLGIIVDHVTDLVSIEQDKRTPPPQVGTDYSHIFVKEIGLLNEKMSLILDCDKLIHHKDLEALNLFE